MAKLQHGCKGDRSQRQQQNRCITVPQSACTAYAKLNLKRFPLPAFGCRSAGSCSIQLDDPQLAMSSKLWRNPLVLLGCLAHHPFVLLTETPMNRAGELLPASA